MSKKKITLEEIAEFTKYLFHEHYAGNWETWFSYLSAESVYLGTGEPLLFGKDAIQFVRNLLLERPSGRRIPIRSGYQTVFVDPFTILYVQSRRKRTELVCIDRIISCNLSLGELAKELPNVFYPLHRGYLVNTLFIISIRRFEAELLSKITLPIPARTYLQVKQDLSETIRNGKGA